MEQVHTSVGADFDISLPATPTAGFKWDVSVPQEGANLVEYLGMEWQTPKPRTLGGASLQRFRFRALAPGEVQLFFRYRRRWETADKDTRTVLVRVGPSTPDAPITGPTSR